MADLGNPKRARGEDGEEGEAKRLKAEELLEMLDGDDAAAAEDLASVMRSFEEEIAAAPPPPPPPIAAAAAEEEEVGGDLREMDLGFFLDQKGSIAQINIQFANISQDLKKLSPAPVKRRRDTNPCTTHD